MLSLTLSCGYKTQCSNFYLSSEVRNPNTNVGKATSKAGAYGGSELGSMLGGAVGPPVIGSIVGNLVGEKVGESVINRTGNHHLESSRGEGRGVRDQ